eukprot:scaffold182561_cov36-Tisochrysis_lutea.AAC.7
MASCAFLLTNTAGRFRSAMATSCGTFALSWRRAGPTWRRAANLSRAVPQLPAEKLLTIEW